MNVTSIERNAGKKLIWNDVCATCVMKRTVGLFLQSPTLSYQVSRTCIVLEWSILLGCNGSVENRTIGPFMQSPILLYQVSWTCLVLEWSILLDSNGSVANRTIGPFLESPTLSNEVSRIYHMRDGISWISMFTLDLPFLIRELCHLGQCGSH